MLSIGAAVLLPRQVFAQGFAGLGESAQGYAPVTPGRTFSFPADHGTHPDFRIEWWYVTANLEGVDGAHYGAQWTLFRQAMAPNDRSEDWDSRQFWMGHAAITSATTHRFAENLSRGGVGTAGAEAAPFQAWIDAWHLKARDSFDAMRVAPLDLAASGNGFSIALNLDADALLALQGDGGFSVKSDQGQASYYYSQPFFRAAGRIAIDGQSVEVTGRAWLDREFSSQPLAANQSGWDWMSLHLSDDEKLMLFRLRGKDGSGFVSGNWITRGAPTVQLGAKEIEMMPLASSQIAGRSVPTSWRVRIASRGLDVTLAPLNPQSWMATRFAYWEGPVRFKGSRDGVGYLEMTGY